MTDQADTATDWYALKADLRLEVLAILSLGEEVQIRNGSTNSELSLTSGTKSVKLSYIPERNAVRWESQREYGFERLKVQTAPLAAFLVRMVRQR